jgi:hypothetical protein
MVRRGTSCAISSKRHAWSVRTSMGRKRAFGHDADKLYVLGFMPIVIRLLEHEPIDRHLWIVEEGRVRVRGSP